MHKLRMMAVGYCKSLRAEREEALMCPLSEGNQLDTQVKRIAELHAHAERCCFAEVQANVCRAVSVGRKLRPYRLDILVYRVPWTSPLRHQQHKGAGPMQI